MEWAPDEEEGHGRDIAPHALPGGFRDTVAFKRSRRDL
jgi:hypothetical protein